MAGQDFGATYSEMDGAAARLRDGRSTVTDMLWELQGVIDDRAGRRQDRDCLRGLHHGVLRALGLARRRSRGRERHCTGAGSHGRQLSEMFFGGTDLDA